MGGFFVPDAFKKLTDAVRLLRNIMFRLFERIYLSPVKTFIFIIGLTLAFKAVYLAYYTYQNLGDDWYYIEAAQTIIRGGTLYTDFGDSHPPFNYLIFYCMIKCFGYSNILTSIKLAYILCTVFSCFFIFLIFRELENPKTALWAVILYTVLINIHYDLWEFNIAILYIYTLWPALYLLVRNKFEMRDISLFFAGFLMACTALISTNTVFFTLLVPLLLYYKSHSVSHTIKKGLIAFFGFAIPVIGCFIYFYTHNALADWYLWNVIWAKTYAFNQPFIIKIGKTLLGFVNLWQWLPFFAISIVGLFAIIKKRLYKTDITAFFALCMYIIAFLLRLIMGKSVPRYYLYFLPGMLFMIYWGYKSVDLYEKKIFSFVTLALVIISVAFANTTAIHSAVHQNPDTMVTSKWIKDNTAADARIFIWPQGDELYYFSERKMATSIFSAGEYLDKAKLWKRNKGANIDKIWNKFYDNLNTAPPDYIVDKTPFFNECKNVKRSPVHQFYYDKFVTFVTANYVRETVTGNYTIYRRTARPLARIVVDQGTEDVYIAFFKKIENVLSR